MQGRQCACLKKLVGQADHAEFWRDTAGQKAAGDGLPQPAHHRVIFCCDDQPPRPGGFRRDRVQIKGLDRRAMQNGDIHLVLGKLHGRIERAHGHQPGRDDEDVAPVANKLRLAQLKPVVRFVLLEDRGNLAAQEPSIDGPLVGAHRRTMPRMSSASQGSMIVMLGRPRKMARSSVA